MLSEWAHKSYINSAAAAAAFAVAFVLVSIAQIHLEINRKMHSVQWS